MPQIIKRKNINLSLVLPCYNEAEHIAVSLPRIIKIIKQKIRSYEIILVEDKSRDNTRELIVQLLAQYKNEPLRVYYHQQNEGRGKSVTDGINMAKGKYVGFIDIDCEVSPKYIPEFISTLTQGNDVICGLRVYVTSFSGIIRALASKLYAFLVRIILRVKTPDTEAGYKFFNREKILPILRKVKDNGWFWDTEIVVRSERAGLNVTSIPVVFERKKDKTSTVNLMSDTWNYLVKLWKFRLELIQENNS